MATLREFVLEAEVKPKSKSSISGRMCYYAVTCVCIGFLWQVKCQ